MRSFTTQGIILARTNFGEADRIITFLTPDYGKVKGFAKGVRKSKSKLAGGLELFSISDLNLMLGKSEINTILSTRLSKHYGNIVKDLGRTDLAYELIKIINKATEDNPDKAYFDLLKQVLESLDDASVGLDLISVWFSAQLLKLSGHSPNLRTEHSGSKLKPGQSYEFNYDTMSFDAQPRGHFKAEQIKFLRVIFSDNQPKTLQKIKGVDDLAGQSRRLVQPMLQAHIRI
jgi:DNA repair protein RecO (recombination protein O)